MSEMSHKDALIIAIGGGKGGVGKSMVSANLAIAYAQAGLKVVLADLDLGGANVHTIFGMRDPPQGLGEYFVTARSQLGDYLVGTDVSNLKLITGGGFVPELANLKHLQKVKLVQQIKALDADVVVLDLGAGTALHVVDFFSMTQAGIVVTTPEPTAVINAYEFVKNVAYRILFRMFRGQEAMTELIKASLLPSQGGETVTLQDVLKAIEVKNPWAAENVKAVWQELHFYLVINQAKRPDDLQLGKKLSGLSEKYLSLPLRIAGMVFQDEDVSSSILKMSPVSLSFPQATATATIRRVATDVLDDLLKGRNLDLDKHYNTLLTLALRDYQQTLLTRHRYQRA